MKREQDAQGDAISKGWFLIISGIVLVGFALQLPYGNLGRVVGDLSDAVYAQASVPDEEEQVAKAIARSLRSKRGFVEVTHIMHNRFGDKLWKVFVTNRWSIVVQHNGSVFGWKHARCAFHVWTTFSEFKIQGTICRIFANR